MKIIISGASGLIGNDLVPFLTQAGYEVKRLVRKNAQLSPDEIKWDPNKGMVSHEDLEGAYAFINLAGENISSGRWSEKKKKSILESRLKATRCLTNTILRLKHPPQVFVNASAVGYYGNRGDTVLTEKSANGTGFLAHVCEEWEEAAKPLAAKGIRLLFARFGIVLSPKGGALAKMLLPFRLGLGGKIGPGTQYMSWISLEDLIGVIYYLLHTKDLSGPVNVVTPNPVTNLDFTKTLGKVLSRPTVLSMPAGILRLILGEMADEMLLSSQRASPQKLLDSGYQFCQPDLEQALSQMLHPFN